MVSLSGMEDRSAKAFAVRLITEKIDNKGGEIE
jgi:hypothetical protein